MPVFKADPSLDDLAPVTTLGDLMVRNASMIARLPVGADGLVLQSDSTQATGVKWGSVSAGAYSFFNLAGATALPSLNTHYALNATAAAFSVTLPVSGATGALLFLQKTDATLNGVTLVGNIEGASLYNLATKNETLQMVWDGVSSYSILEHRTRTPSATYTPVFGAFGTVNGASLFISSYREGRNLVISGDFVAGTPGASAAMMSVGFGGSASPVGLLIDNSALGGTLQIVGNYGCRNTNSSAGWVVNLNGATMVGFGLAFAGAGPPVQSATGANLGGVGNHICVGKIELPISGWQP